MTSSKKSLNGNILYRYNLPDTVVWNPWDSKAKEMEDFGDDEVSGDFQ